ncbi:HAD family hydrolase [Arthrobacter sp. MMS18-M83]|uniref:HAD family hydrolase n=1 Tax=Arthrobacter sp. MMS18-M83 TaxID=2996261 RepID=UPI002279FCFB|nr:HAD family phosphatase [Arthrobacter sp. MMS18-M83]WAH96732.1 HAD family phosphatase [Arthrobacter sp. MMS18-M83]
MMPAAVLFDMDGTLVDTERLWWDAVAEVAFGLGRTLGPEDGPDILGRPSGHTATHLLATMPSAGAPSAEELSVRLDEAFTELVAQEVVPRPGAVDLLRLLAAERIPTAIVSASPRRVVELVRDRLGRELFTLVVAVEDTPASKPAPDPYLEAARLLGAEPADCVVVEDSPVGLAAAEAAGCPVVVVPSTVPIDAAPGRTLLGSLAEVTLSVLAEAREGDR